MSETSLVEKKRNNKKHFMQSVGGNDEKLPLVIIDAEENEGFVGELVEGVGNLDVSVVVVDEGNLDAAYEAADFVILLGKNDAKLMRAWSNGTVPVCAEGSHILNYDPVHEKGNAFVVDCKNQWGYFAALVRGLETYKFPYDWRHLVDMCFKQSS